MALPPDGPPETQARGGAASDDFELLRLTAEIIGFEAAAVVVLDDRGAVVRASWPLDRAGLELPDLAADELLGLLESLGGVRGGRLLTAPLDEEGRLNGVLCGITPTEAAGGRGRTDPGDARRAGGIAGAARRRAAPGGGGRSEDGEPR